jgi:hypothetical protein
MSTASDYSVESLFAQLVAQRLRSLNRSSRMSDDSAFGMFDSDGDAFPLYNDLPTTSADIVHRLTNLEVTVASMAADLKTILMKLSPVAVGQVRGREPEVDAVTFKSQCTSSDSSQPASPIGFQFMCPLCLKPQQTPKSHCEHLKNTVGDGVHNCRFIPEHSRHAKILTTFKSAQTFVAWYCSHLRSGMGSKFSPADVEDYKDLQQQLDDILSGRKSFVCSE